jgi:hypothetical protein
MESLGNCCPEDIADLSQIEIQGVPPPDKAAGPGPVRRRKTSLRLNPLASGNADDVSWRSSVQQRRRCEAVVKVPSSSPQTPLSRVISPTAIRFHNLMPVYPGSDDFPSHWTV